MDKFFNYTSQNLNENLNESPFPYFYVDNFVKEDIFKNLNSLDAMKYFSDYIFELILSEYSKDNADKVRDDMVSWSDSASQELNSNEIINPESITIETLPNY